MPISIGGDGGNSPKLRIVVYRVNQLLLDYFGQLVSQAQDVPKLNAAILQLAVQGKLVAQDPNDEPASELLKRIAAEKKCLGIKGVPLREIGEEERPFALPGSWEWARMNDITLLVTDGEHATPPRIDYEEIPLVTAKNVRDGYLDLEQTDFVTLETAQKSWQRCEPMNDDLLMVCVGATTGRATLAKNPPPMVLVRSVALMRPYAQTIFPEYLEIFMKSPLGQNQVWNLVKRTAQPVLYLNKIKQMMIPLPPLAEQKRIVERVDALLAQTRELESRLTQAETSLTAVHNAAINTLLAATDPDDFAARWQFIADNFDLLYDETYPETAVANIAQLKQAILQLAVQGKLTRQEPQDEPASALLQRIAAEKERLGIKSMELAEIGEGERPFVLPDGWEWIRLGELAKFIDYRGKTPIKTESGMQLITAKNVKFGYFSEEPREYVDPDIYDSWMTRGIPRKGDVLFTPEAPLGNVTLLETEEKSVFAQRIITFQIHADYDSKFLKYTLMSVPVRNVIESKATGTTALGIKASRLKTVPIPVPPLAEQKRIVARVNSLLHLCDELSAHIQAAQATRVALRDAVLGS